MLYLPKTNNYAKNNTIKLINQNVSIYNGEKKMIDSHCHLEFKNFDDDREKVIKESKRRLKAIVNSCANPDDFSKVKKLTKEHPNFIFSNYGLHPSRALNYDSETIEMYKRKIKENMQNVYGIGEIGLDYHHVEDKATRQKTKEIFLDWLKFSDDLDLPAVIHSRNAMQDTLNILEKKQTNDVVIHCFSGKLGELSACIDRNYYISMGGLIFRSNAFENLVEEAPLDMILLETDAPFLAKNKERRNNPWFVEEVAERIAEIKELEFEEVWKTCAQNAKEVFDLPVEIK